MPISDTEKKVLDLINERKLVELAVAMGNIYSPAGYEAEMGEFVLEWLKNNKIKALKQEVVRHRYNVIGQIKGTGNGSSLLFNSHMDSGGGGPEDEWVLADPGLAHHTKAWVQGDRIFGNAVLNDRGPMAAFMIAKSN